MVPCSGKRVLLSTKLTIPQSYPLVHVERTDLYEQVQRGSAYPLLLLSAPAGAGKTTLLSSWAMKQTQHVAWFAPGEQENDVHLFWRYIFTTLQPYMPVCERLLVEYDRDTDVAAMLTDFINHTMQLEEELVLVVDNAQLVTAPEVWMSLTFLLEHMPPRLHLLISTRVEPALPLARLRVRGQLCEIEADALRFSMEEATEFLAGPLQLLLSQREMAILMHATEGWIAGLQLAALSLQGLSSAEERSAFIAAFTGLHRHVMHYMTEEVFAPLPVDVQRFLLGTAILQRMQPALCNYVLQQDNSEQIMEWLRRANLLVATTECGQEVWWRYHPLFVDLLRAQLEQSNSVVVEELHRRAGQWYEQRGYPVEAIEHALAVGEYGRVVTLLEQNLSCLCSPEYVLQLMQWLSRLDGQVDVSDYPHSALLMALYALHTGNIDEYELIVRRLEELQIAYGEGSLESMLGELRVYRALLAGEIVQAQALLQRVKGEQVPGSIVHLLRAATALYSGDTREASVLLAPGRRMQAGKHPLQVVLNRDYYLALLAWSEGLPQRALTHLQQVSPLSWPGVQVQGLLMQGEIYYEWNETARVEACLAEARQLQEQYGLAALFPEEYILEARVQHLQERPELALLMLDKAEWIALRGGRNARALARIAELRVQYLLIQGKSVLARNWFERMYALYASEEHEMQAPECEVWSVARARLCLQEGEHEQAIYALHEAILVARAQGRGGAELELSVVLVQAYARTQNPRRLKQACEQIVALGERGGYQRTLLNEGVLLGAMLKESYQRQQKRWMGEVQTRSIEYVHRLLHGFGQAYSPEDWGGWQKKAQRTASAMEQLSEREQEVLHLIAEGHTNQQIAQRLIVAESTIKTHLKNIYSKLNVNSRLQALTRAHAAGLID